MKSVTLAIRTAYVEKTTGITFLTKVIPVFEEYVQETATKKKAILTIGTMQIEAYIILLNQTVNDNSPKCQRNDQTSIQAQVTTVFPLGKGGTKTAEQIAELFMDKLFVNSNLETNLVLPPPFHIWKSVMEGVKNINYTTDTNSVWITQLILNHYVSQS